MSSFTPPVCGRSAGDVRGENMSWLFVLLPMLEKTLAGVMAGDSSGVNVPLTICERERGWGCKGQLRSV